MSQKPAGYRDLVAASLCRPWRPPLFGAREPLLTPSLRVMVWTDDAEHQEGDRLTLDVFPRDGTSLKLRARVDWLLAQPADGPARYRLGLTVHVESDAARDVLERLLQD